MRELSRLDHSRVQGMLVMVHAVLQHTLARNLWGPSIDGWQFCMLYSVQTNTYRIWRVSYNLQEWRHSAKFYYSNWHKCINNKTRIPSTYFAKKRSKFYLTITKAVGFYINYRVALKVGTIFVRLNFTKYYTILKLFHCQKDSES